MYLFIPYRTFYPFLSHFDIYTCLGLGLTSFVNNRSDVIIVIIIIIIIIIITIIIIK